MRLGPIGDDSYRGTAPHLVPPLALAGDGRAGRLLSRTGPESLGADTESRCHPGSVVLSSRANADGEGHLREIRTHRVHRRLEGVKPPIEPRFQPIESRVQPVDPGSKARVQPVDSGSKARVQPVDSGSKARFDPIDPRLRPDEPRLQPVDPPVECVEATPGEPCQKSSDDSDDRRVDRRSQEIHQPRILSGGGAPPGRIEASTRLRRSRRRPPASESTPIPDPISAIDGGRRR